MIVRVTAADMSDDEQVNPCWGDGNNGDASGGGFGDGWSGTAGGDGGLDMFVCLNFYEFTYENPYGGTLP